VEALPWINEAKITSAVFPGRVSIHVREEEPWIVAEYRGHSWLVSQRGTLLQTLDSLNNSELIMEISELPRLGGLQAESSSRSFLRSENVRFDYALQLLEMFEMAGGFPFQVERITLEADGALRITAMDIKTTPEIFVQASTLAEARHSLQKLKAVLADLAQRSEHASRIDLRFLNQAIVK
jgi:cell division septal protein FtsQ